MAVPADVLRRGSLAFQKACTSFRGCENENSRVFRVHVPSFFKNVRGVGPQIDDRSQPCVWSILPPIPRFGSSATSKKPQI